MGARGGAGAELAMGHVASSFQTQHVDCLEPRIDNPVLRDACAGIVGALPDQITLPIFRITTYDLHDEIGSLPVLLGDAALVLAEHEGGVRFANLFRPQLHPNSREQSEPELPR